MITRGGHETCTRAKTKIPDIRGAQKSPGPAGPRDAAPEKNTPRPHTPLSPFLVELVVSDQTFIYFLRARFLRLF